jgi:hypothetical protein
MLAQPSVLSPVHETPRPRGAWRRWANTGPASLARYGYFEYGASREAPAPTTGGGLLEAVRALVMAER